MLLYLLLQECTRDIAKVALSKMAKGRTDGRTSAIYALTGLALGCCPLFFIFMIISPVIILKASIMNLLMGAFFINVVAWLVIGLLLNLEFFMSQANFENEYDVFIS